MKKIDDFCDRFGNKLIWGFISIYVLIFFSICSLKYFSFGYTDWDFASDVITYWNSVHGRMFYYPFLEQSIFGAHLYLIMVFLIPVYAVFQHPLTLLFLQSLFLGAAAYPLYLLARSKLGNTFALVISMAYLLYPPLGHANIFETHFDAYALFFLFFALYFFEKEDFRKFLIFIFLAIFCKENVSLLVFMFGVYALLRKRPKRWILFPSLLGAAWFFLSVKFIIPYFSKDASLYQGGFMFNVNYQHLGATTFEMLKNVIMHPIVVVKYSLSQEKILYLFQLFLPTGFVGFLNPAALLMAAPIFMQNLLSSGASHSTIYYHYTVLLTPFIFYSVIGGFKKLSSYKTIYKCRVALLAVFLAVSIASGIYLKAPQLFFVEYLKIYRVNDLARERDRLVKMIPKDASVIATFQFLPKLAHRRDLCSMHFVVTGFKMYSNVKYEPPENLEYALIDLEGLLMINSFFSPQSPANIRNFLESGNWKVLGAVENSVLFKKDCQDGYKLCEVVQNPRIANMVNANIANQMGLLGYEIAGEAITAKNRVLHLILYWTRIREVNEKLGFFVKFVNAGIDGEIIKSYPFGYRIYPPDSLPEKQIVKTHRYILIPGDMKKGIYNMSVGLYISESRDILPVLNNAATSGFGHVILGDITIN